MQLEGQEENFHGSIGALRESTELYIKGSDFESFLSNNLECKVLDIGLGLGYNALSTIEAWLNTTHSADLELLSLEIEPKLVEQLRTGLAPWQANWQPHWIKTCKMLEPTDQKNVFEITLDHPKSHAKLKWKIALTDAVTFDLYVSPNTKFDFFWQDPFSKKISQQLWTHSWFSKLLSYAQPNSKLMTYSVAGDIRRALSSAGWEPQRFETGFKQKRQWLRAVVDLSKKS